MLIFSFRGRKDRVCQCSESLNEKSRLLFAEFGKNVKMMIKTLDKTEFM